MFQPIHCGHHQASISESKNVCTVHKQLVCQRDPVWFIYINHNDSIEWVETCSLSGIINIHPTNSCVFEWDKNLIVSSSYTQRSGPP
jgi:hypothetical protein